MIAGREPRGQHWLAYGLLGALAAAAVVCWRLHSAFRATPANFPVPKPQPDAPIPVQSLRMGYRKSKEAGR